MIAVASSAACDSRSSSALANLGVTDLGRGMQVSDANPLLGIYAARTRQDAQGEPVGGWMPEQRLGPDDSVRVLW